VNSETIDKLTYAQPGSLKLGGNFAIVVKDIDMSNINDIPATNQTVYLQLAGDGIWSIEAPKELVVGTSINNDDNGYSLTKTGDGMLRCTLYENNSYTGKTVIAEGTIRLEGYGTQLKSYEVVVGDGIHPAMLDVAVESQNVLGVQTYAIVTVNTNGLYQISSPAAKATFYPETYIVNGGTIDFGGNELYLINIGTTPWDRSITMTGGIIKNGTVSLISPTTNGYAGITTRASDETATISTDVKLGGERYSFYTEDGAAPVDLEISGRIRGTFGFTKAGPGVLALSYPTGSDMRRERKPIIVSGGTLLMDGGSLPVSGSNSVNVVAGGTLGGTGAVCSLDTAYISGHVTLEGASGDPAILAPGTVDRNTGEWLCGTLSVGTSEVTNNVTFINYATLRSTLGPAGTSSCLAVVGAVKLDSSMNQDALEIITPTANVPSGEHVLVTFSNFLTGRFDDVTLNGETLPDSYSLEYLDASGNAVAGTATINGSGSIVLTVPVQGTLIIVK
jgi:autotransporter-associated beta strand protein